MKISKRERTLIIIVLLLAGVAAYFFLFFKPHTTEMSKLNTEKANSEIQVETYSRLKINLDNLDKQIEQKEAEIIEYSKNISAGFDQPPVLVYLEDTVGKFAQKKMFSFGQAEYLGQMTISPVSIAMVTTYDGLKSFIDELTKNEFIVNVTGIEVWVVEAAVEANEEVEEEQPVVQPTSGETPTETGVIVPAPPKKTPKITDYINEGARIVANSDQLLDIMISLEIYTMFGEVPSGKVYIFDDNDYAYGGDIFY